MALSEFVAMEAAYRALQPLDKVARRRALRWLKDVLAIPEPLPEPGPVSAAKEVPTSPGPVSTESELASPAAEPAITELAGGDSTGLETAASSPAGEAEAKAAEAPVAAAEPAVAEPEPAVVAPAAAAPAKPVKRAPGTTRGAKKRAAAGGGRGRGGRSAAKPGEKERVYRRMPPVEVVLGAYREVGTVSGLAGHFGVPRHTVQGWARRLRANGYEIGRKSETDGAAGSSDE